MTGTLMRKLIIFLLVLYSFSSQDASGSENLIYKMTSSYVIHVTTVQSEDKAMEWISQLGRENVYPVYYIESRMKNGDAGKRYQVFIGGFENESRAREKGEEIAAHGIINTYYVTTDRETYIVIHGRGMSVKEILTLFFREKGSPLPLLGFDIATYAGESFTPEQAEQNYICLSGNNKQWGTGQPVYSLSESTVVDMDGDTEKEIVFIFHQFYELTLFPTGILVGVVSATGPGSFEILDTLFLEDPDSMGAEEGHDYEITIKTDGEPELCIIEKIWQIGSGTTLEKHYRLTDKKLELIKGE